jgi:hypothetical protein
VTQWPGKPPCGVFGIPGTSPRADALFQVLDNLRCDAAVNVFSFGGVLHRILLQKQFFSSRNPRRFGGVQRRGHVKGAVCPRSSQTLDREHRWNNAGLVRRGLSGEKNERKTISAKKTERKVLAES